MLELQRPLQAQPRGQVQRRRQFQKGTIVRPNRPENVVGRTCETDRVWVRVQVRRRRRAAPLHAVQPTLELQPEGSRQYLVHEHPDSAGNHVPLGPVLRLSRAMAEEPPEELACYRRFGTRVSIRWLAVFVK